MIASKRIRRMPALFYSGMALAEAGRLSAAALELDEAVRLDSQRPEYLIFHANLFARLKQKTRAEDALATLQKQGAEERLESSWLWMLSDVYYRLERFHDALRTLDRLEQRNPDDPRTGFESRPGLRRSEPVQHSSGIVPKEHR